MKVLKIFFISVFLLLTLNISANAYDGKININTASAKEIKAALKNVGVKYAEAIVKYRKNHGDFKKPEDIKKVKGIGVKTFEINKHIIIVKRKKNSFCNFFTS